MEQRKFIRYPYSSGGIISEGDRYLTFSCYDISLRGMKIEILDSHAAELEKGRVLTFFLDGPNSILRFSGKIIYFDGFNTGIKFKSFSETNLRNLIQLLRRLAHNKTDIDREITQLTLKIR